MYAAILDGHLSVDLFLQDKGEQTWPLVSHPGSAIETVFQLQLNSSFSSVTSVTVQDQRNKGISLNIYQF